MSKYLMGLRFDTNACFITIAPFNPLVDTMLQAEIPVGVLPGGTYNRRGEVGRNFTLEPAREGNRNLEIIVTGSSEYDRLVGVAHTIESLWDRYQHLLDCEIAASCLGRLWEEVNPPRGEKASSPYEEAQLYEKGKKRISGHEGRGKIIPFPSRGSGLVPVEYNGGSAHVPVTLTQAPVETVDEGCRVPVRSVASNIARPHICDLHYRGLVHPNILLFGDESSLRVSPYQMAGVEGYVKQINFGHDFIGAVIRKVNSQIQ